jgi:hypothetical protein
LPASHLVEVNIKASSERGPTIKEIPRIIMKESEDARGEPLVGAAAKVAGGFFWIALSSNPHDVASNMALLLNRDWIDLPFIYESGQRAILTLEKGLTGRQVFERGASLMGGL